MDLEPELTEDSCSSVHQTGSGAHQNLNSFELTPQEPPQGPAPGPGPGPGRDMKGARRKTLFLLRLKGGAGVGAK